MAGAFAHMCLVDQLSGTRDLLADAGRTGKIAWYAIRDYLAFCELGAVSPDLPYLDILHDNSKGWANVMHYWRTSDILRAGVSYFAGKNLETEDPDLLRALAWFFGYAAHVATDLTVHPVLAASGYPYATNPFWHRYCELQQDAYIFRMKKGVDESDARYIENCGIESCCDPNNPDSIHPAISKLWLNCLSDISPTSVHMENGSPGPTTDPVPDVWFGDYIHRIAEFVEHGGGFGLLLHGVLKDEAVCLPKSGEVEQKYIRELKTPTNGDIDYDAVFNFALENVRITWEQLCKAIEAKNQTEFALMNANLDTGISDSTGTQVFWS